MKNAKRILSGLLVLVMVLALCPVMAFAEEPADVTINIAAMSNGSVTTDKDSYKVGDTVVLTVTPENGYVQKLYINDQPLLLDGNGNTYTFQATETAYAITGEFVAKMKWFWTADFGMNNMAHGVVYAPANNGKEATGELVPELGVYNGMSVLVKDPSKGTQKNFAMVLKMPFTNGQKAEARLINEGDGKFKVQAFGNNLLGNWAILYKLTDAENEAILNGDGVWYGVQLVGSSIQLKINDAVVFEKDLAGNGVADKSSIDQIKVQAYNFTYGMNIPYRLHKATSQVVIADMANGTVTADKEIYNVGETVTLTVAPYDGYVQQLFVNGKPLLLEGNVNTYSFVATEETYEITGGFVPKTSWFWTADYGMLNQGHNYVYAPAHAAGTQSTGELVPAKGKYSGMSVLATDASHGDQKEYAIAFKVAFKNGQKAEIRLIDRDDNGTYRLQVLGNNLLGNWATHYSLTAAESAAVKSGEGVWFGIHMEGTKIVLKIDNKTVKEVDVASSGITGVADIDQIKLVTYNFGYATHIQYRLHAIEAPSVNLTIADTANGTVTADKDSYKVGDTVNLTIAANAGYAQKLYINGEPLLLGWKTNTYSFVATEENYEITGSFEQTPDWIPREANRWDTSNRAHGILNAYYPSSNDTWHIDMVGDYKSIAVNAKNYQSVDQSYEGNGTNGGYRIALFMQLDNGKYYAFSIWVDANKEYAFNHYGGNFNGVASTTGWGGAWCKVADKSAAAAAAIGAEGATFKLDRISGNQIQLTINGFVLETYTIEGVTEANKVLRVGLWENGNRGFNVVMPYTLEETPVHEHAYTETVTAPTCAAPGYTTYTCSCGDTYTGNETPATGVHTYDDDQDADCNVCGATREVGPAVDANLNFLAAPGLSFQDYIGMQVLVPNTTADKYDRIWVEAVQADPAGDVTATLYGAPYFGVYQLFEQQILSWSMTENVTLTLYAEKDGKTYVGQTVSASVQKLATDKIASYESQGNTKAVTALVDMLNYGKAVQLAFSHNVENLPTAGDYVGTTSTPAFNAENNKIGTGAVSVLKDSISMQAKVEVQLLFAVDISAYTVKATVGGEDAPFVIDTETMGAYGWTLVRVAIGAAKMRDTYTIALYDAEGNAVTQVYEVSVEAYGAPQLGTNYNDVVVAMMRYGDSVAAI